MSIKVSNETEFRSSFLFLLLLFTRFFTRFLHTKDRNVFLSKPTSPILLLLIVILLVAELSSNSMGMAWAMRQNQARQQNYRPPQRARQHQIRNQQREQQRAQANAAHQQVAAQQQKFKELAMEGASMFPYFQFLQGNYPNRPRAFRKRLESSPVPTNRAPSTFCLKFLPFFCGALGAEIESRSFSNYGRLIR